MRGAWRKSPNSSSPEGGLDPLPEISPGPANPEALRNLTSSVGPEQLSEAFRRARRLDYNEILEDGFRDAGGRGLNEACPEGMPLAAAAVFVVDRRSDSTLAEFVNRTAKKLVRASDPVTKVMLTALLVSEALGRSGEHAATVRQRCEQLVVERLDPATGTIHLGAILHEQQQGMPGNLKQRKPGAGTSRHRAMLFKALADWLSIAPCALCRDKAATTWNTVLVEGEPFVVDVMFDPGALYEESSGKASEYLSRLQQESRDASSSGASVPSRRNQSKPAPSVQQNLGGRMLRPSWHVEPWEVEFDRRDRAGRGGFGEVFHGGWAGQMVAVKEVRDASPTDGDICDFILEISLLSRLSHPNVIRFWRGCVDLRGGHRTLLLVTEWMDRGVLSSLLHESQEPNLTFGQILALAAGIARGIAYLHHVKILHLDLKSPNVLLNSAFQPKLCDFGLAKLREQTSLHTTLRGVSPIWAPPEVFDEQAGGVTEKADVYSFGIVLFELATRKLPYADVSQMSLPRVKARGQLPKFPEDMDADVSEFVKLCLSHRAAARPAMPGVVTRIQQLARKRNMDLEVEQARMERHGLHFGGPAGSMPNLEQLRRAEVEKRRAELEVARLRRLLQDEEAKVRAVEEQLLRQNGGAGVEAERQSRMDDFIRTNTQAVGDAKFRCGICRKLFRGTEFVHKHIRDKHVAEMLGSTSAPSQNSLAATGLANAAASNAGPHAAANDDFFDADVAEESDVRSYTQRISGGEAIGTKRFNQALQDAAEAGDASKLQQCLLQGGSELNQADVDGATPLQLAARHGHSECVQYMISNTCDVNAANESGLSPLHLAAQEGHSMICELLLQAGSVVDAEGGVKNRTALHLSAANGHREVCTVLLLSRASVDCQDKDGESALHNAARFGDRQLCEVILSFGANVGLADNDGWSALHEAARWGDGGLVDSLLQRGADVNARSNDGESPLHVVPGGYAEFEVVEVLLHWRCDANCKDFDGETPLHVAVKLGDVELAEVLLKNGADANAANTAAATPLDFARKDEIRWLLRSHKARKGAGAN